MYGFIEPTEPPDPDVLARHNKHEATAKWCAKWLPELRYACLVAGLLFILLPTIWSSWGRIVAAIPVLSTLSHDYSHLRGLFLVHFPLLVILGAIARFFAPHLPQTTVQITSYSETVAMALYPTTRKAERAYYICMADNIIGVSMFLMFPFGFIAFLFHLGK